MFNKKTNSPIYIIRKITSVFTLVVFLFSVVFPPNFSSANILGLPVVGSNIIQSSAFTPILMKGLKLYPANPLQIDFIVDPGQSGLANDDLQDEGQKLIKYFLATLTTPSNDMWVNLSPYEKDRIIPEIFGQTEMGRDLLSQDYILKQLTASLLNPDRDLGNQFWERVYESAREQYGTVDIPVNTFNKVWIVPQRAVVYENGDVAFVAESHLKVMLDSDYMAMKHAVSGQEFVEGALESIQSDLEMSSEIVREIILPAIEEEVNVGANFANLRQIYSSMILATWYKRNLKESILGKVYADQNKVDGVNIEDKEISEKIYQQYLETFKKGAFEFIKEDYDPVSQEVIERKYFSGGFEGDVIEQVVVGKKVSDFAMLKVAKAAEGADLFTLSTGFDIHHEGGVKPAQDIKIKDSAMIGRFLSTEEVKLTPSKDFQRKLKFNALIKDMIFENEEGIFDYERKIDEDALPKHYFPFFRGMRLTPNDLNKVLKNGLEVSTNKLFKGRSNFTVDLIEAKGFAFEPWRSSEYPTSNFVSLLIQVNGEFLEKELGSDVVDLQEFSEVMTVKDTVPARLMDQIWIYNKKQQEFVPLLEQLEHEDVDSVILNEKVQKEWDKFNVKLESFESVIEKFRKESPEFIAELSDPRLDSIERQEREYLKEYGAMSPHELGAALRELVEKTRYFRNAAEADLHNIYKDDVSLLQAYMDFVGEDKSQFETFLMRTRKGVKDINSGIESFKVTIKEMNPEQRGYAEDKENYEGMIKEYEENLEKALASKAFVHVLSLRWSADWEGSGFNVISPIYRKELGSAALEKELDKVVLFSSIAERQRFMIRHNLNPHSTGYEDLSKKSSISTYSDDVNYREGVNQSFFRGMRLTRDQLIKIVSEGMKRISKDKNYFAVTPQRAIDFSFNSRFGENTPQKDFMNVVVQVNGPYLRKIFGEEIVDMEEGWHNMTVDATVPVELIDQIWILDKVNAKFVPLLEQIEREDVDPAMAGDERQEGYMPWLNGPSLRARNFEYPERGSEVSMSKALEEFQILDEWGIEIADEKYLSSLKEMFMLARNFGDGFDAVFKKYDAQLTRLQEAKKQKKLHNSFSLNVLPQKDEIRAWGKQISEVAISQSKRSKNIFVWHGELERAMNPFSQELLDDKDLLVDMHNHPQMRIPFPSYYYQEDKSGRVAEDGDVLKGGVDIQGIVALEGVLLFNAEELNKSSSEARSEFRRVFKEFTGVYFEAENGNQNAKDFFLRANVLEFQEKFQEAGLNFKYYDFEDSWDSLGDIFEDFSKRLDRKDPAMVGELSEEEEKYQSHYSYIVQWAQHILENYEARYGGNKLVFIGASTKRAWEAAYALSEEYGVNKDDVVYLEIPRNVMRRTPIEILTQYMKQIGVFDGKGTISFFDNAVASGSTFDILESIVKATDFQRDVMREAFYSTRFESYASEKQEVDNEISLASTFAEDNNWMERDHRRRILVRYKGEGFSVPEYLSFEEIGAFLLEVNEDVNIFKLEPGRLNKENQERLFLVQELLRNNGMHPAQEYDGNRAISILKEFLETNSSEIADRQDIIFDDLIDGIKNDLQNEKTDSAMLDSQKLVHQNIEVSSRSVFQKIWDAVLEIFNALTHSHKENRKALMERHRSHSAFYLEKGENGIYFVPVEVEDPGEFDNLYDKGDLILDRHLTGMDVDALKSLIEDSFKIENVEFMEKSGYVGTYCNPTGLQFIKQMKKWGKTIHDIKQPVLRGVKTRLTDLYSYLFYGYRTKKGKPRRLIFKFDEYLDNVAKDSAIAGEAIQPILRDGLSEETLQQEVAKVETFLDIAENVKFYEGVRDSSNARLTSKRILSEKPLIAEHFNFRDSLEEPNQPFFRGMRLTKEKLMKVIREGLTVLSSNEQGANYFARDLSWAIEFSFFPEMKDGVPEEEFVPVILQVNGQKLEQEMGSNIVHQGEYKTFMTVDDTVPVELIDQVWIFDKGKMEYVPLLEQLDHEKVDSAMVGDEVVSDATKPEKLGGIDMNEELLDIETRGSGFDFDIPIDLQGIDLQSIEGLSPVIFQIVPTNMPALLGISEKEEGQEQVALLQ